MTASSPSPVGTFMTSTMSSFARGLLALLLALAWALAAAPPAAAAGQPGIQQPEAGDRITGTQPQQVVAFIDAATGEEVRGMEIRVVRGGDQIGPVRAMDFKEVEETGPGARRTRWSAALHPLTWDEGEPLRNGTYQVQVRAQLAFQGVPREPTDWRGVELAVDADPPATTVTTKVLDAEQRRVEVAWEPVILPDFKRYLIQRRLNGGAWLDYRSVPTADRTRWADSLPADGEYAYRVQTVRAGADGASENVSGWSAPSSVQVRKPAPPAPPPSAEADQAGPGSRPAAGRGGPPVLRVNRPIVRRPPLFTGPDTYEPVLDYGAEPPPVASGPEGDLAETGGAPPEGTLSVDGGGRSIDARQVLVPVAAGLLLTMSAWHLRRFMRVSAEP